MYENGQVITLRINKTHGDNPEYTVRLRSGVCGMVVNAENSADGNHKYIIDFGPEGQWHCTHEELQGNDPQDHEEEIIEDNELIPPPEDNQLIFDPQSLPTEDIPKEVKIINPEVDMKHRIKELEKGIKIK